MSTARNRKCGPWWLCFYLVLAAWFGCSETTTAPVRGPVRGPVMGNGGPDFSPVFPMHHSEPSWSQKGLIAYEDLGIVCVNPSGSYLPDTSLAGLWILNPETGDKRRLLPWGKSPDWSPDGNKLVFGANGQVYTVGTDGTGLEQLTVARRNFSPAWSPDGQWIAYRSDFFIWIMRPDGNEQQDVSGGFWGATMPSWNPDATQIIHIRHISGVTPSAEVYTTDCRGLEPRRLTHNLAEERHPRFSPDGRRVAFSSQSSWESPALPQIWVMQVDGSEARQLTTRGGSHPSWSPDGTRIVLTREDWKSDTSMAGVLWVVNVETGEERQLTHKWPESCGGSSSYSIRSHLPSRRASQPIHP